MTNNTVVSVFATAIQNVIDELPPGKDAPDHSTSRRLRKHQFSPQDDLCSKKHGGDFASTLAHDRALHGKKEMYRTLIEVLEAHGPLTSHEISEVLGLANRNKFAPRLSEMKALGMIERTGELRGGAYVLRLVR
ncbi:MAG TPA: hypothetical protein VFR24_14600 [Candidatus Angelobacter sp.]|nr:hypothetical protein [Candidatus Angelobacter sp.]